MTGLIEKIKDGGKEEARKPASNIKTDQSKDKSKPEEKSVLGSFLGQAFGILLGRIDTEKSSTGASLGKYVFKVSLRADKEKVKKSVESYFNTKVKKVNILTLNPKKKIFKGEEGIRSAYKKAIVTLKEGLSI
jgi:large subunit ribosomal protein L23